MPPRVYTTRFIHGEAVGKYTLEVPAGRRAVVKSVSMINVGAGQSSVGLAVHGVYVVSFILPVQYKTEYVSLSSVAYEHETIRLEINALPAQVMVTGYLYEDIDAEHLDFTFTPTAASKPGELDRLLEPP